LWKGSFDTLAGYLSANIYSYRIGNLGQIFDFEAKGWNFHYDILERYGRVTRLRGLVGVRIVFLDAVKPMTY